MSKAIQGQSEETIRKLAHFAKIISSHTAIVRQIGLGRPGRLPYIYVDATAGCGIEHEIDGEPEGSPLIALQSLCAVSGSLVVRAYFFEKTKAARDELHQRLEIRTRELGCSVKWSVHGDNEQMPEIVEVPAGFTMGLIYFDTNGGCATGPTLQNYLRTFSKIDLAFYMSPTNIKRHCRSLEAREDVATCPVSIALGDVPYQCLRNLKPAWLIRKPTDGAHHWSFAVGSSLAGGRLLEGKWKKEGFYSLEESLQQLRQFFPRPIRDVQRIFAPSALSGSESGTESNGRSGVRTVSAATINGTASPDLSAVGDI